MRRRKTFDPEKIGEVHFRRQESEILEDPNLLDSGFDFGFYGGGMPPGYVENKNVTAAANALKEAFVQAGTPEQDARTILSSIANAVYPPPMPLPDKPPELWSDDSARRFVNPRDFLEEIYGPWLKNELSWPYLHQHDRPLYNAVRYQLKKAGIAHDDYLPSKSALVRRDLERAGPDGLRQALRIVKAAYPTRR